MIRTVRRLVLPIIVFVALAAGGFSAAAAGTPTVKVRTISKYGKVLTTPSGMTLYYYTVDTKTASKCTGVCATMWPPLLLPSSVKAPVKPARLKGTLSTIKRGTYRQVSYNGHPLYRYVRDHKPGQTTGESVGGVWYVMKAK